MACRLAYKIFGEGATLNSPMDAATKALLDRKTLLDIKREMHEQAGSHSTRA